MVHLSCTFSMHGNVQEGHLGSGGGLSDPLSGWQFTLRATTAPAMLINLRVLSDSPPD